MADTTPLPETEPLPEILSVRLDGAGGGVDIPADEAIRPSAGGAGFVWLHLRRDGSATRPALTALGLDSSVIAALTADETRPRCTAHGPGLLVNLRGVNLSPGAEPEDMISVRLWLTAERVVGVWVRPLHAVEDIHAALRRGEGPVSPGDFTAKLVLRLADRAEPAVAALNERIDAMEEAMLTGEVRALRPELSDLRRRAILLRRHMVPQRDALTTMEIEDAAWLSDRDRIRLREAAERVMRLGEELDAIRDRAQIVHEQIMDARAEALNRRMLLLAVISAVFLPLSLIAGLLGMNVGGIPGAAHPDAFWVVAALVTVIGLGLFLWVRLGGPFR